jgi:hypothetical protein
MSFLFGSNQNYQKNILEEFCRAYYGKMSNGGIYDALSMFDKDATCTIDANDLKPYDMVLKYSKSGIHHMQYQNLSATSQFANNMILISVAGMVTAVGFQGWEYLPVRFSETFVLRQTGNNIVIVNYIMKTIQ